MVERQRQGVVTKLVFYRISLYNYQRLPINTHTLIMPHLITIEDH